MSADKRQKMIGIVKGLRAKTIDRGATEEEAKAATELAEKLMKQYELNEAEVTGTISEGPGGEVHWRRDGSFPQGGGFPADYNPPPPSDDFSIGDLIADLAARLGVRAVEHATGTRLRDGMQEVYEEMSKQCSTAEERASLDAFHKWMVELIDDPFGVRR